MHDDMELHVEGSQASSAYWQDRLQRLLEKHEALLDDIWACREEWIAAMERERAQAREPKPN